MSLTQRYLMFLSYLGTGFRGSQIQPNQVTVQGVLQEALKDILKGPCLLSDEEENNIKVVLTSRTDSGVHATKAGVHVDIPLKDRRFLMPYRLQYLLNYFFSKREYFLRVSDCLLVPDTFDARYSVLDKTYCYRVAINKNNHGLKKSGVALPITELIHTHFVFSENFDYSVAKEVASLFVGVKDFATFCGKPSRSLIRSSICNVKSSDFEESHPLLPDLDLESHNFTYYAFKCRGNRFLYRMVSKFLDYARKQEKSGPFLSHVTLSCLLLQVRRMVSTILAASTNRITVDTVRSMIEKAEPSAWMSLIKLCPGKGLHLIDTVYKPDHLLFSEEEVTKKEPYWSQLIEDPGIEKKSRMSFANEILSKRKELKSCVTVVTSSSGSKHLEIRNDFGESEIVNLPEICPGFVVDEKLDLEMAKILSYLYLSSQDPAHDGDLLKKNGITHVLSIGVELSRSLDDGITRHKVDLLDEPQSVLEEALNSSFEFIENARMENENNKILLHCNAGYSRAPSIVIGYLMKTFGYSFAEAFEMVKEKRNIRPNDGFIKQLKDFEKKLSS